MKRSRKILLVSHCILNSNSKIEGLSQYGGVFKEVISIINSEGIGIIQLPCPEMIAYGIKRWGHVKEQFDTLFYRNNCREMLKPIVGQVKSYMDTGYEIIGVLGIDGSPSCGVNLTCSGNWGGELSGNENLEDIIKGSRDLESQGVFMEELDKYFKEYDMKIPFIAIDERDVYSSLSIIENFIGNRNLD